MKRGFLLPSGPATAHRLLFGLCFAAYTAAYLGRLGYSACLAAIIADCGFTRAEGGMVGTAFFVVYGACQLAWGLAGDKAPPQRMILAGLAGAGAVNLAFGFARTVPVMTGLWCLNAVFQSLLWSPIIRIFAEWFLPEYRRAACLAINVTVPVGTVAAYLCSALFLRWGSWRGQFRLAGLLLLGMAGVWAALLPPLAASGAFLRPQKASASSQGARAAPSAAGPGLARLLGQAGLPVFFFALAAQGVLKDGVTTWVPSFTQDAYGLTGALSVFGAMFLPLANIGGVYLASWLDRRFFRNELCSTGALFFLGGAVLGLLYLARGAGPWPAYLLLALSTTAMMGANTLLASSLPLAFAPWGRASSAAGVLNFCIYLGCGLSVWGTGLVSAALGWGPTILGWAGVSLAGAFSCLAAARRWQRFKQGL